MDDLENELLYFDNSDKYYITSKIVNKIEDINKRSKILYFNYFYSEEELKDKFKIFNNKNIIIINNINVTIDSMEKYLKYSKPKYVVICYYVLTFAKRSLRVKDKRLRYIFHKLEEYKKKYNIKFIIAINKENGNKSGDL